jgi:5-methylcytosine-specific restriction endonuclease McrA
MNLKRIRERRLAFLLCWEKMAKDFAKPFYNSKTWQAVRRSYIDKRIAIDGGLCEVCHKRPGTIVHHIENLSEDNIRNREVSANHDNLRLDCKECHDHEEGHFANCRRPKKAQLRCSFDQSGQPIPPI